MKKLRPQRVYLALFLLLFFETQMVYAATSIAATPLTKQAVTFVHLLVKQNYQAACEDFDAQVKHALPPEQLAAAWQQMTGKLGTFKTTSQTKVVPTHGYVAVFVKSIFDNGAIWVQLAYDKSGKIAGVHFVPTS